MKIYAKMIPSIARDIVQVLTENQDIEVNPGSQGEAQKDFEAILNEYVRKEHALVETTKNIIAARGWGSSHYGEAKRIAASAKGIPLGEDAVEFVINQMLEYMLISPNIDEVFSEDHVMRKRCVEVVRRYLKLNDEIEEEVRRRLKHLTEGTKEWEISYQRVLEQVRRNKGID